MNTIFIRKVSPGTWTFPWRHVCLGYIISFTLVHLLAHPIQNICNLPSECHLFTCFYQLHEEHKDCEISPHFLSFLISFSSSTPAIVVLKESFYTLWKGDILRGEKGVFIRAGAISQMDTVYCFIASWTTMLDLWNYLCWWIHVMHALMWCVAGTATLALNPVLCRFYGFAIFMCLISQRWLAT